MVQLYKRSGDGAVICGRCLPEHEKPFAAELDPALFPATYHHLHCSSCGAAGSADVQPRVPRRRPAATG